MLLIKIEGRILFIFLILIFVFWFKIGILEFYFEKIKE